MSEIKESLAVHSSYHKSRKNRANDMVLVKIRHLHDDMTQSSELRMIRNPKRPIYVTKPKYKLNVKPEYNHISKVNKIMTTESNMFDVAKKALKYEPEMWKARSMRDVNNSPNIFWSSVSVSSIILHHLRTKQEMNSTSFLPTVGAFDFEWDVDTNVASIGSYAHENKSTLVINREHFARTGLRSEEKFIAEYKKKFAEIVQPVLDEYYSRKDVIKANQVVRNFVPEIVFADNEFMTARETMQMGNRDKVDYFTAWNGHADLTVLTRIAESYAEPLHKIISDDSIPGEFKNAFFKEGQKGSKKDANGTNKSVKLQDEWHELIATTQYQYVDMMGTYHRNRIHLPDAPSPSLNWALTKELGFGKLKIDCGISEDDQENWHRRMSLEYFLEYCLYASMDTISLVVLEDKNYEISSTYFSGVGYSPYSEFVRNPMRLSTDMHFAALEDNLVICGVGSNMSSPIDKKVVPSRSITVTLNPSYNSGMSMSILKDSADKMHIVPCGADGDLTSSYPSNQILSNGSRGTTLTEYCGFNNMSNLKGNSIGYTLSAGPHSNYTVAQDLLKLPSGGELIKRVNKVTMENNPC